MQKFFTNQKALIGIIGLAILGSGNALATSTFNSRTNDRVATSNILAYSELPGTVAHESFFGDVTASGDCRSNNSLVRSVCMDSVSTSGLSGDAWYRRRIVNLGQGGYGILSGIRYGISENTDGQFVFGGIGLDRPDASNLGRYDGTMRGSTESLPKVVDIGASDIHAKKVGADAGVEVSPVPLPAAVWSFLVGLLGILGLKKRKQAPADTTS
ncbi:MAG: hypothetical protein LUQ11_03300 [Methylococcaceae bacterium]|nr:hypothetical protein [Methylococcaceae bacterium]